MSVRPHPRRHRLKTTDRAHGTERIPHPQSRQRGIAGSFYGTGIGDVLKRRRRRVASSTSSPSRASRRAGCLPLATREERPREKLCASDETRRCQIHRHADGWGAGSASSENCHDPDSRPRRYSRRYSTASAICPVTSPFLGAERREREDPGVPGSLRNYRL